MKTLRTLLIGLGLAALAAPALAQRGPIPPPPVPPPAESQAPVRGPPPPVPARGQAPPAAQSSAQALTTEQVVAIIRRRTPGQLIDAPREGNVFKVRWKATNGRLINYVVDAVSGAIVSASGE